MEQAQSWLVLGLVFGILLIWFGLVLGLVSLPLAKGQVRATEYNYRPLRPLFKKWFGLTDEVNDEAGRKGAKWMVAFSIVMVVAGICAILFGLASIGNPLILMVLVLVAISVIILGGYIYAIVLARRKHT